MNFAKIQEITAESRKRTTAPLGITFLDLESESTCSLNGDQIFPSASTFKVFVLLEIFRMVERGDLAWDQRYRLEKEVYAPGSGLLKNFRPAAN